MVSDRIKRIQKYAQNLITVDDIPWPSANQAAFLYVIQCLEKEIEYLKLDIDDTSDPYYDKNNAGKLNKSLDSDGRLYDDTPDPYYDKYVECGRCGRNHFDFEHPFK